MLIRRKHGTNWLLLFRFMKIPNKTYTNERLRKARNSNISNGGRKTEFEWRPSLAVFDHTVSVCTIKM